MNEDFEAVLKKTTKDYLESGPKPQPELIKELRGIVPPQRRLLTEKEKLELSKNIIENKDKRRSGNSKKTMRKLISKWDKEGFIKKITLFGNHPDNEATVLIKKYKITRKNGKEKYVMLNVAPKSDSYVEKLLTRLKDSTDQSEIKTIINEFSLYAIVEMTSGFTSQQLRIVFEKLEKVDDDEVKKEMLDIILHQLFSRKIIIEESDKKSLITILKKLLKEYSLKFVAQRDFQNRNINAGRIRILCTYILGAFKDAIIMKQLLSDAKEISNSKTFLMSDLEEFYYSSHYTAPLFYDNKETLLDEEIKYRKAKNERMALFFYYVRNQAMEQKDGKPIRILSAHHSMLRDLEINHLLK
jgi:hypothetical protein